MMDQVVVKDKPVSKAIICEVHRILATGIETHADDVVPGEYRTHEVGVKYGQKKATLCMRWPAIGQHMKQTCKDLGDDVENEPEPFALATRAIRSLCISIGDGNGLVARILINAVLLRMLNVSA